MSIPSHIPVLPKESAALVEHQRRVLRLVRHLVTLAAVPVLGLEFARTLALGKSAPWLRLELALSVALGIALTMERERSIRRAGGYLFAGTLGLATLALLQVGPTMDAGALLCTSALIYSFFLGGVVLPSLVVLGVVLLAGIAVDAQQLPVDWSLAPAGLAGWLRMMLTLAIVVFTVTLAQDRIVVALERAIRGEHEARVRERRAQQEREASLAETAKSRHLEVIGRLAGGVAHDFNNTLTVLGGGMSFLREASGRQRDEVLRDMEAAVQGATATTRQLLALARQGSTLGGVALPGDSLRALGRNLQRIFPENVRIEVAAESVPQIALPSGEFEQAVLNLCLNARDAMPEGGTLALRCARSGEGPDARVLVEVSDTGLGMSHETAARAIEPLFTTKPPGKGTGLGLSLVDQTVSRCGGQLEILSSPGGGTTIRMTLPVAADYPCHDADGPEECSDRGRVLLLEDDPAVRRALLRALHRQGHTVVEVDSVARALQAIDSDDYDVLITDGILRDGECSPVIARFRAESRGSVVVCTGHVPDSGLLREIEAGAVTFLAKPVYGPDLIRAVNRGMQQLARC